MPDRFPQEVVLRDGRRVLIRTFNENDADQLFEFFQQLPIEVRDSLGQHRGPEPDRALGAEYRLLQGLPPDRSQRSQCRGRCDPPPPRAGTASSGGSDQVAHRPGLSRPGPGHHHGQQPDLNRSRAWAATPFLHAHRQARAGRHPDSDRPRLRAVLGSRLWHRSGRQSVRHGQAGSEALAPRKKARARPAKPTPTRADPSNHTRQLPPCQ